MFGMGPARAPEPPSRPAAAEPAEGDVAALRRELQELKQSLKKRRR
jgi:hypothetical protein